MDNRIIDLLLNLDSKIDKINEKINNLVTKKECSEKCNDEVKKNEWTVKKITGITALLGVIVGFIKLIFFNK